jgi:peptidoglycan hydrolase-like protein with peptidoglycan-binding domain
MKKFLVLLLVVGFTFYMFGCGRRKQATLEEMQEPVSIEALSAMNATASVVASPQAPVVSLTEANLEPLPPGGPYKPSVEQIQTALKNAQYYTGNIDGKIGPLTKKAIEDFQKANALQVDGKAGPRTWAALSRYLNAIPAEEPFVGKKQ